MTAHFASVQDFLSMGGYGAYVWSAYGITLGVFVLQVIQAAKKKNKNETS